MSNAQRLERISYELLKVINKELMNANSKKNLNILSSINESLYYDKNEDYTENAFNLNFLILRATMEVTNNFTECNNKLDKILIEVVKALLKKSYTFQTIFYKDDYYNLLYLIEKYVKNVSDYYIRIFSLDNNNLEEYVKIIDSGKLPSKKMIVGNSLEMDLPRIQNTLHLLNEAVRKYYEIYYRKILITNFSNDEMIEFRIKESELAHLMGVNLKSIVRDSELVSALKITPEEIEAINDQTHTLDPLGSAAVSILHKMVAMSNDAILNLEEDRIKKSNGFIYPEKSNRDVSKDFSKYSKINMRSKAFIDFNPFEEVSMIINLPKGYSLIKQNLADNSNHSVLIAENPLSSVYNYTNLVSNYDISSYRRYFMSLLMQHAGQIDDYLLVGRPAISKMVILEGDGEATFPSPNGALKAPSIVDTKPSKDSTNTSPEGKKDTGKEDDGDSGIKIVKAISVKKQQEFVQNALRNFNNLDIGYVDDYFASIIRNASYVRRKGLSR